MIKKISIAVVIALSLTACRYTKTVTDGRLPAEAVPYATQLTGTYSGFIYGNWFKKQFGEVTLSMVGDRLQINSTLDLVGARCGSSFGKVLSVSYRGKQGEMAAIADADFEFNPGSCARRVSGRVLNVRLTRNSEGQEVLHLSVEIKRERHGSRGQDMEVISTGGTFTRVSSNR